MGIIFLAAILTLLICIKLAFTDDNISKYNSVPDITPAQTIAINAVAGKKSDISEKELNSIIAYLIEKANSQELFDEENRVLAVCIDLNENEPCRCYVQMKLMNRELGLSTDVNIRFNSETRNVKMIFSHAKIGRLPISQAFLKYVLEQMQLDEVTDTITTEGVTIKFPAEFTIDVPVLGSETLLEIESLEIEDNAIQIETNSILSNTLDGIKDNIGEKIFNFAQDYLPDSVGGYLEKFDEFQ